MELIGLSRSKAAEMLHHGSVHGRRLTNKQKDYFRCVKHGGCKSAGYGEDDDDETGEAGFVAKAGFIAKASSSGGSAAAEEELITAAPGGGDDGYLGFTGLFGKTPIMRRLTIIGLLNKRTKAASREALDLLCELYGVDEYVGLEFSGCEEKPVSPVYPPFRTGYANRVRIHICSDSLGDAFNAILSKQIRYDPARVTHYCAVFLHEFAHVLDKRAMLPADYGGVYKNDIERRADHWAQHFIDETTPQ